MPLQRAYILNDDKPGEEPIVVQYNPKEITLDKTVPWQKHKNSKAAAPVLEYTAGDGKNLAVELLLDSYEGDPAALQKLVDRIERLSAVTGIKEKTRPPICTFVWGKFPKFRGVVENMSVKYTMFLEDGTPCRAIVTLKLKQAAGTIADKHQVDHRKKAEAAGHDDVRTA